MPQHMRRRIVTPVNISKQGIVEYTHNLENMTVNLFPLFVSTSADKYFLPVYS